MPQNAVGRSRGVVLALLLGMTLAVQSCQNFLLQGFNEDKVFQASAGQGWRDGHGFTVPVLQASGFARAPLVGFPPGYSLLYGVAIGFSRDPFHAGFLLDTVAAVAFCAAWYVLLVLLSPRIGTMTGLIVAAYWAMAFSPLVALRSSDALSLGLYSASVALAMCAPTTHRELSCAAAAGMAGAAAAAVRFPYWPLVAVPLLVLMIAPRPRRLARLAAYAAPAGAVLVWAALTNFHSSGQLQSVVKASRQIYWQNFFETAPFGSSMFGFDLAWSRLAVSVSALAPVVPIALWTLTAFVLVIGVAASVRDARQSPDPIVRAFATTTLSTLAITAVLIFGLGALTPPLADGWTIDSEAARYFGPTFPFLMVAFVRATTGRQRVLAWIGAAILIGGGASLVGYRVGQLGMTLTMNREAYPSGPKTRARLGSLHRLVRGALESGRPVLYCDPDLTREYFAIMAGAVAPRGGCSATERQAAMSGGGLVFRQEDVPQSTGTPTTDLFR